MATNHAFRTRDPLLCGLADQHQRARPFVAVIRHQQTAENGDIVVAMVDESVTLKRLYREKNRIRLQAENDAYPPIFTQNVRILGKLAHLIRRYE